MIQIMIWWGVLLLIGIAVFPFTNQMFLRFRDGGWLFSKMIGLFLTGWLLWACNCMHLLAFTATNSFFVVFVVMLICYGVFLWRKKKGHTLQIDVKLLVAEEILFLLVYLAAIYIIGFKPEAYGTEKQMDYAFLTAMARNLWMPFEDPWYAGESVNYYYGGQFYAAFLMKLTGVTAGEAYNFMRATITSASFALPFSLVFQMLYDRMDDVTSEAREHALKLYRFLSRHKRTVASVCGGILAGLGVAFAGNGHYILYGVIYPLTKGEGYSYWFPDSTRYIGYDPDMPDKTIHEFPAYSSVLGDLHAHYINIIFVVTVTALVYAWAQKKMWKYTQIRMREMAIRETSGEAASAGTGTSSRNRMKAVFKEGLFNWIEPEVLLIGFMTGAFRWTNFWDFPIYYVVCGSIFFFVHLILCWKKPLQFIVNMGGIAAVLFGIGTLAALPFTLTFDQISSEIGMTHSHTMFYQLVILWGLPVLVLLVYVVRLVLEQRKERHLPALSDLATLLFGLCAAGLVWLPEVIYVKDIYTGDHYRANTMFKLSYQAYILFALVMGYVAIRLLTELHHKRREIAYRVVGLLTSFVLVMMSSYTAVAVNSWFGDITVGSNRISNDASVFVSQYFPDDYDAINWLNENVHDLSVILEAPGDSYSDYGRVSVATGLPTVAGWYVHEWLWRGGNEGIEERVGDVEAIYTGSDYDSVSELIDKYDIRYIYIGTLEREKYPEIQEEFLQTLGEVVYSDGVNTYIIEVAEE